MQISFYTDLLQYLLDFSIAQQKLIPVCIWIALVLMTRRRDFWEDPSWPTALSSPRDRPPHPPPDVMPLNCPHLNQPAVCIFIILVFEEGCVTQAAARLQ